MKHLLGNLEEFEVLVLKEVVEQDVWVEQKEQEAQKVQEAKTVQDTQVEQEAQVEQKAWEVQETWKMLEAPKVQEVQRMQEAEKVQEAQASHWKRQRYKNVKYTKNKAKAISAELLELSLKNKLEETGKKR